MRQSGGKSRQMHLTVVALCTAVGALALSATAAGSSPAVDQYTAGLPTANGPKSPGGDSPSGHPGDLPADTRHQLSGAEDRQLAQIATASELGAPQPNSEPAGSTDANGSSQGGTKGSSSESTDGPSGGPGPSDVVASTERGLPAAAASSAGSDDGFALLAVLAAIALLGLGTAVLVRRRRSQPRE